MKTKEEMRQLVNNYYLSMPVIADEALDEFVNELIEYFNSDEDGE